MLASFRLTNSWMITASRVAGDLHVCSRFELRPATAAQPLLARLQAVQHLVSLMAELV